MRGQFLLAFGLMASAAAAQEPLNLACEDEEGQRIDLALWSPSANGPPLHCIDAATLQSVVSCAPDGGWGLSRDGALVGLATEAAGLDHEGGWFFASVGPSEFVASASAGTRPPLALEVAGETFWRLRLTLATGEGSVHTRAGLSRIACQPA